MQSPVTGSRLAPDSHTDLLMPAPTHAYPSCVSSACEKLVGLMYPAAPAAFTICAPDEYDVALADTLMSRSRGCPLLPAPCERTAMAKSHVRLPCVGLCVYVSHGRCDGGTVQGGAHGDGVAEADAATRERAGRLVGRAGGDGGEAARRALHAGELVAEGVCPVHVDAGVGHFGQVHGDDRLATRCVERREAGCEWWRQRRGRHKCRC